MNGYFDYNATSPARPEAVEAMARALRDTSGNPSSMHAGGRRARALIDHAREQVAALVRMFDGLVRKSVVGPDRAQETLYALAERAERRDGTGHWSG